MERIRTHAQAGATTPSRPPAASGRYTVRGQGFVALGPTRRLIAAIAKPGEKTLEKALTPELHQAIPGR